MIMDCVAAIVDRSRARDRVEEYSRHDVPHVLSMLGNATATIQR